MEFPRPGLIAFLLAPLAALPSLFLPAAALAQAQDKGAVSPPQSRATPPNTRPGSLPGTGPNASGGSASSVPPDAGAKVAAKRDLYDELKALGNFNSFVKAVDTAGLVPFLKGAAPNTVFAPTDAAFAKLPKKEQDKILGDKDAADRFVKAHLGEGRLNYARLAKLGSKKSVLGPVLDIESGGKGLFVEDAHVGKADINATNGIIHTVDNVIKAGRPDAGPLN